MQGGLQPPEQTGAPPPLSFPWANCACACDRARLGLCLVDEERVLQSGWLSEPSSCRTMCMRLNDWAAAKFQTRRQNGTAHPPASQFALDDRSRANQLLGANN